MGDCSTGIISCSFNLPHFPCRVVFWRAIFINSDVNVIMRLWTPLHAPPHVLCKWTPSCAPCISTSKPPACTQYLMLGVVKLRWYLLPTVLYVYVHPSAAVSLQPFNLDGLLMRQSRVTGFYLDQFTAFHWFKPYRRQTPRWKMQVHSFFYWCVCVCTVTRHFVCVVLFTPAVVFVY